jgi:hypothetical protein
MTFEIRRITPGDSLDSFQPSKYQIAGLRIDNPSGCWYRVSNNGRIIPPWTLGSQMLMIPNVTTLSIDFLPVMAGQPSKIIGNELSVLMTDEPLQDAAPISIANAIPYVNTFVLVQKFSPLPVGINGGLWSIWPTHENMRIRLAHLSLFSAQLPAVRQTIGLELFSTDTDATSGQLSPLSRDGDDFTVPQTIVRARYSAAQAPSLIGLLDHVTLTHDTEAPQGPWVWDYDLTGPGMPPSAFSPLRKLGMTLFVASATTFGGTDRYDITTIYTEETLE